MTIRRVQEAAEQWLDLDSQPAVGKAELSVTGNELATAAMELCQQVIDLLAGHPDPEVHTWTVLGTWEGSDAVPFAVVEGDLQPQGDVREEGGWNVTVTAPGWAEAQAVAVHKMMTNKG